MSSSVSTSQTQNLSSRELRCLASDIITARKDLATTMIFLGAALAAIVTVASIFSGATPVCLIALAIAGVVLAVGILLGVLAIRPLKCTV
ncbi:hypothetical protein FTM72_02485 [Chlamydia trachomatis]|uniref:hypothetical protein n=1 Tax=Chlamydia muridarum TaxID=83560 RepID=UPI000A64AB8B|nr:hypothetical protein [Chlamydia muridarum]UFT31944.1 hypothetical protein FTN65_02490 [Chlamydia trachomatis]UFX26316.1 hypothetical protein FTM72_02485 [Chlamydia trachomatis]UFX30002.1 hypothetical protein FTM68_02515 [Chlamydia trachomatis]UFX50808.1 hypothetical protein FTM55_02470 [Chlamydia trachomatis]UFX54669.1 hypothetical protein FTM51_02485 [Chlamydia trachomatis]